MTENTVQKFLDEAMDFKEKRTRAHGNLCESSVREFSVRVQCESSVREFSARVQCESSV